MEYLRYKGKGEHSVNELEKIIEQREEELHLIKSGDVVKNYDSLDSVRLSCFQEVWQKWAELDTKEFDSWLHDKIHEA